MLRIFFLLQNDKMMEFYYIILIYGIFDIDVYNCNGPSVIFYQIESRHIFCELSQLNHQNCRDINF